MTRWVLRLIIVNVAVFLATLVSPDIANVFALVPAHIFLRPWTLITYMFLHANFGHIFFNLLALFFFGPRLEAELGEKNFALLYFISGIMGGVLSFFFMPDVPIIGASGAIFGVMLGFAYFWPHERIFIYGLLPVPAWLMVVLMTGLSLYGGFGSTGDNVAHFAHLGGFLGGYLSVRWFDRRKRSVSSLSEVHVIPFQQQDLERWQKIPREKLHVVNREEYDRIMMKISTSGVESLTMTERGFLDRFSAQ